MVSKGNANRISLGDRMKEYESVHTQTSLVPGIPVYVRIDGRAFHTFTRGLGKPFDNDFAWTMKETTKHLHDKTNAFISYYYTLMNNVFSNRLQSYENKKKKPR